MLLDHHGHRVSYKTILLYLLHYPIHEYRKSSQPQVRVRHELRVGGGSSTVGGQADPAAVQAPRPHTISNAGRHRSSHQESSDVRKAELYVTSS